MRVVSQARLAVAALQWDSGWSECCWDSGAGQVCGWQKQAEARTGRPSLCDCTKHTRLWVVAVNCRMMMQETAG